MNTPPFIAIDQEGGRVHRLPSAFTHFPAAAEIGVRRNRDLAYRCGRAAATNWHWLESTSTSLRYWMSTRIR